MKKEHHLFIADRTLFEGRDIRMKESVSKTVGIILVLFILISLCPQTGFALDNLFLTGFVRSIDSNSGIISLDITSESCRGPRVFRVPDDSKGDLDASLIGKKIQFMIDSSRCERGRIYNIVFKEQP
jgi:hypothetical protein